MAIRFKYSTRILKEAVKKWWSRDPFRQSSIIAYNAIFSLPGLLVVVVSVAGSVFGPDLVNEHLHDTVAQAMGNETADQVEEMIRLARNSKASGLAAILGVATILIGATGVFVQLQKSMNIIWEVRAEPGKSGLWAFVRTRLFSFGLILSIAFLLLISLVISSLLAAIGDWMTRNFGSSLVWLVQILSFAASLVIITLLFALMFKMMPDAKIRWHYVWTGAFVTALLFAIGKSLLGFYFGQASPGSGYGAAGSIILIMLWTSYSSMIVFFGAEFTKVYSNTHYGSIPANEIAKKENGRKV